jgi:hypothetical protein
MDNIIDEVDLDKIMASGPSIPNKGVQKEVPNMPLPSQALLEDNPIQEEKEGLTGEEIQKKREEFLLLPSEKEQANLKQRWKELRVVPIPYSDKEEGKMKVYILRQLTRANWRAMMDNAVKLAANRKDGNADELFKEKIVCMATVWPNLDESYISQTPPGLVDTLFGVIQQMGFFFNPDTIMELSYIL